MVFKRFVPRHESSGNSGAFTQFACWLIGRTLGSVPRLARSIDTLGSIVSHAGQWKAQGYGKYYRTRESLWDDLVVPVVRSQTPDSQVQIFEFGVAFGEASRWWLSKCENSKLEYYGFDLFTGLPRAWRAMPEGAFNASGKPPAILDERVNWRVGDVTETIKLQTFSEHASFRLFMFDLDLFEPSLIVWRHIQTSLKPGDYLWFDEAFDRDERVLLDAEVLTFHSIQGLGYSPFGLLLKIGDQTE